MYNQSIDQLLLINIMYKIQYHDIKSLPGHSQLSLLYSDIVFFCLPFRMESCQLLSIVWLIGANISQNCSIDEESMKLSTRVLWYISFDISYGSTLKNSIWPPFSRWRKRDEFWTIKLFLWHVLEFFLRFW
jgi:hypothetical protein